MSMRYISSQIMKRPQQFDEWINPMFLPITDSINKLHTTKSQNSGHLPQAIFEIWFDPSY